MKFRLTVLLSSCLLISACTAISILTKFRRGEPVFSPADSRISFELQGHKIMVPVRIDSSNREYSFLFDTGAMSAIDIALADSLGLLPGQPLPTPIDTLSVYLTERPLTLSLAEVAVRDLFLVRFDMSNIFRMRKVGGFIGSDLVRHFCVTIDYAQRELTLGRDYPEGLAEGLEDGSLQRLEMKIAFSSIFPGAGMCAQ